MQLTYDSGKIDALVKSGKSGEVCELLDQLHKEGQLPALALVPFAAGVMLPPWADYEYATALFEEAMRIEETKKEAAIWACYLYVTLFPVSKSFVQILEGFATTSAEASFLLGQYFLYEGEMVAAKESVRKSIEIEKFPANMYFAVSRSLVERDTLAIYAKEIRSLIKNTALENITAKTFAEQYQQRWQELVRGELKTSIVWESWKQTLSKFA